MEQRLHLRRVRPVRKLGVVVHDDDGFVPLFEVVFLSPRRVGAGAEGDPRVGGIPRRSNQLADVVPLVLVPLVVDAVHDPRQEGLVEHRVVARRRIAGILLDIPVPHHVGDHHEAVHQGARRERVDLDDPAGDPLGLRAPIFLLAELVRALERADGAIVKRGDPPGDEAGDLPLAVRIGLRVLNVDEDGHLGFDLDLAGARIAWVLHDVRCHREGVDLVQYLALARGVGVGIGRIGAVKGEDVCRRFPAVLRHPRLGHVPGDVPRDAQPEATLTTPSWVKVSGGLHRGDGGKTLAKLGEVHLSVAILVEGVRQIVSGGLAAEGLTLGQELIAIDLTVVVGVDRAKYGPLAWMRFLRIRGHRARAPSFVDDSTTTFFSTSDCRGDWPLATGPRVCVSRDLMGRPRARPTG